MSDSKYNQEEDLKEIKEGFEMFDVENKGLIDPLELRETMEEMNLKEKNPFIYDLISSLCIKKEIKSKGGLTSEDFISYLKERLSDVESEKGIETIFNVFSDLDNKIPMPTFYQTAREVGDEEGGAEIRDLVEKSKTGGKEIDFDEFYDIMREENPKEYSNKKNKNKSKKKFTDKKDNEVEYEYNYKKNKKSQKSIEKDDEEPKSGVVIVEKIVTEQVNDQPTKISKSKFTKRFGLDKEENDNDNEHVIKNKKYTYQSKRNDNEIEDNENTEKNETTKRYHRRYRGTNNSNNSSGNNVNSNNNTGGTFTKYRRKFN